MMLRPEDVLPLDPEDEVYDELCDAIEKNNSEALRNLMTRLPGIEQRQLSGLCKIGEKPYLITTYGFAVMCDQEQILNELIETQKLKQETKFNGVGSLWLAACYGRWGRFKQLLEAGAEGIDDSPIEGPYAGVPAILFAAGQGKFDIVELLLSKGAKNLDAVFNSPNPEESGITLLLLAATCEKWDLVKKLFDKGIKNLDALEPRKNNQDATALYYAGFFGRVDIIRLFLERGVELKNGLHLSFGLQAGLQQDGEAFLTKSFSEAALLYADVEYLFMSATNKWESEFSTLEQGHSISKKVPVEKQNLNDILQRLNTAINAKKSGKTALQLAVEHKQRQVVRELLMRNADLVGILPGLDPATDVFLKVSELEQKLLSCIKETKKDIHKESKENSEFQVGTVTEIRKLLAQFFEGLELVESPLKEYAAYKFAKCLHNLLPHTEVFVLEMHRAFQLAAKTHDAFSEEANLLFITLKVSRYPEALKSVDISREEELILAFKALYNADKNTMRYKNLLLGMVSHRKHSLIAAGQTSASALTQIFLANEQESQKLGRELEGLTQELALPASKKETGIVSVSTKKALLKSSSLSINASNLIKESDSPLPQISCQKLWDLAGKSAWKEVESLLDTHEIEDLDFSPGSGPYQGLTILYLAAAAEEWEIVKKILVKQPKNLDATPLSGEDAGKTVLWHLVSADEDSRAWSLVKPYGLISCGAETEFSVKGTSLIEAIQSACKSATRKLTNRKLICLEESQKHLEMVAKLFEAAEQGQDLIEVFPKGRWIPFFNAKKKGKTVLQVAMQHKKTNVITLLLLNGVGLQGIFPGDHPLTDIYLDLRALKSKVDAIRESLVTKASLKNLSKTDDTEGHPEKYRETKEESETELQQVTNANMLIEKFFKALNSLEGEGFFKACTVYKLGAILQTVLPYTQSFIPKMIEAFKLSLEKEVLAEEQQQQLFEKANTVILETQLQYSDIIPSLKEEREIQVKRVLCAGTKLKNSLRVQILAEPHSLQTDLKFSEDSSVQALAECLAAIFLRQETEITALLANRQALLREKVARLKENNASLTTPQYQQASKSEADKDKKDKDNHQDKDKNNKNQDSKQLAQEKSEQSTLKVFPE